MALNRDMSVLLAEAIAARKGRQIDFADALAGTGARAARVATETQADVVVHANDAQPEAVEAMRLTVRENGVASRVHVHEGDAHVFLAGRRFDVVDVDPCGSPMPFLDAAVRATRHAGILCVTATDTGALAGAFPRACLRRYGAHHGLHAASWRAEVGLRILAGAVVRSAARSDRAATPMLSIAHGHWMRVVARIEDGKKDADAAVRRLGIAKREPATGRGWIGVEAPAQRSAEASDLQQSASSAWAGPLWTGPLHEKALVEEMAACMPGKSLAHPDELRRLFELARDEADAPPFWIVPHDLRKAFGEPVPRRDAFMKALAAQGGRAARSHLDPQGVRTDAGITQLQAAWKQAGSAQPGSPFRK
jgi:tRNA (guanine26-N2/guanine27-N2)-dimethyltransferase